jgi:hypothetical protein
MTEQERAAYLILREASSELTDLVAETTRHPGEHTKTWIRRTTVEEREFMVRVNKIVGVTEYLAMMFEPLPRDLR